MRLSLWRPGLITWLSQYLDIDTWLLQEPDSATHVGFLPPLRAISYSDADEATVIGSAVQDIFLRSSHIDAPYKDLPIKDLESLHATLAYKFTRHYQAIAPILSLDLMPVDQPVSVIEAGDRSWIAEVQWSVAIRWVVEPDAEEDPLFNLNSIRLRVWRDRLDHASANLDFDRKHIKP